MRFVNGKNKKAQKAIDSDNEKVYNQTMQM